MPMEQDEIVRLIEEGIPGAKVEITDLRDDGDHFDVKVESEAFVGLSCADQHRLVFGALQGRVGGVLRSLMLSTVAKGEALDEPLLPEQKQPQNMDPNIVDRIRSEVHANDVVLYMRGSPVFPQCSFSAQAVQFLSILGVAFKSVDVLLDPMIRQGIRDYSNWPTVPQLFVKGSFVGGADVIRQMFETGELEKLMRAEGIACHINGA